MNLCKPALSTILSMSALQLRLLLAFARTIASFTKKIKSRNRPTTRATFLTLRPKDSAQKHSTHPSSDMPVIDASETTGKYFVGMFLPPHHWARSRSPLTFASCYRVPFGRFYVRIRNVHIAVTMCIGKATDPVHDASFAVCTFGPRQVPKIAFLVRHS